MTYMDAITLGLGIGFSVLGWFAKELWGAVKSLKEDLIKLKDDMTTFYVRKDDFREFRTEILAFLQRIETKLDTKQDKQNGT